MEALRGKGSVMVDLEGLSEQTGQRRNATATWGGRPVSASVCPSDHQETLQRTDSQ